MSLMPTAPRSIGGVLDDALRLYRRTLGPCFPIALIAVILISVPTLFLTQGLTQRAVSDPAAVLALFKSPLVLVGCLALVVVMCAVYGALFAQINAIAHGERLTLGGAFGVGLQRASTMTGASLLFMLVVMVGMVLLVVPGIYLWGLFQLAFAVLVVERAGVFESFGISRRLIKGNWWRSNVIIFVAMVIMYVLMLVAGIIVGVIAAASVGTMENIATSQGYLMTQQILSSVLNLFVMSFLPCILLSVYYDLKLRNEGADLMDRVGALNQPS